MATAAIENIDANQLSIEEKYAFAILTNLSVEQVDQIKQRLKLGKPGVIGPDTLRAFLAYCQEQGFALSVAGVNSFKANHRLNNTGQYTGVIGRQTAGVYFDTLFSDMPFRKDGVGNVSSNDLNTAIVAAAESLLGLCTSDGPDGGNHACAWSLNRVFVKAGIPPLGENPNYVPSLVEALRHGRGQEVSRDQAKPGDLVVANGEAHIGVGLDDGCQTVLSNSSSRARFQWKSDTDFDGYYGGPSTIYRLVQ